MIAAKLKEAYLTAEPVTLEFTGLMRSTFAYYSELQSIFLAKLPKHLHQSELAALLNTEIRPKLFNHAFCDRIQEALKSLRRAIVRLEDLRAAHAGLPAAVNNLATLAAIAEQVEALYQKHWEYYRYQANLTEPEMVAFLLEVERAGYDWDVYLESFTAAGGIIRELSGKPLPDTAASIRIAYQRAAPEHFAAETMTALMGFLQACYGFIAAVHGVDTTAQPLTLLQIEIGEPVELNLAVPKATEEAFRQFLQYLFLKDMLQRDALLKIVMEAVLREHRPNLDWGAAELQGFQKEIGARLKALPEDGRFQIADRRFPEDGVLLARDFIASLEEKDIPTESLLGSGGDKFKRGGKMRKTKPAPEVRGEPGPVQPRPGAAPGEHIRVLTEREPGFGMPVERK